ncbi:MAG TPA: PAS domain S-box protein, partial [Paracoccaceae bacterium]
MDRNEAWGSDPGTAPGGRLDLLSILPLAAIALLVVLIGALVWLVNRDEAERARVTLATDALWVEQTLRFHLSNDEDMLVRLALDHGRAGIAPETLEDRARLHIANNPEVLAIGWYDVAGRMTRALPQPGRALADPDGIVALYNRASTASARPVYGDLIQSPDGGASVDMAVRTAAGQGVIVARISVSLMIERQIPWWIAEQYAVQLLDAGGVVLAEKARVEPQEGALSHNIGFDPPLRGTVLRIASYQAATNLSNTLLLGGIAGLAVFAILALLALQRNAARRRRAELRLRGEMAFRRSMEESLTVGLRAKDHEGRVLYVNTAFCQLVGLPAEALVGMRQPMPYWSEDRLEETLARQRALAAGGARPQSFETRFRRSDGAEIDVQVYEAPLVDAKGAHRGWMGSIIDITEAKRAARGAREQEESLQRTGRLVTLGEMASTLAHEL